MPARRIPIATLVAGGLLAGGVAAAGALNASGALAVGGPSPTASSAAPGTPGAPAAPGPGTPGPGQRGLRGKGPGRGFGLPGAGLGGRMLHGEVVVAKPSGGTETLLVQFGTVTQASSGSITVKSSDGFTQIWSLSSGTTIRTGWRNGTTKELVKGDTVEVVGTRSGSGSGSGGDARFVAERRPEVPGQGGFPGGPRHQHGGPGGPSSGPGGAGPGGAGPGGGGPAAGVPSGPASSGAGYGTA